MSAPARVRPSLRAAVFFDRDGTLTREIDWVRSASDLELLDGAAEAVARVNRASLAAVVVTNQSAVARGVLSEAELERVHDALRRRLAESGARIDGVYACPHHPTEGEPPYRRECDCRKPKSGLIARAARELALDLARSWVVGDAERDLLAGSALGVPGILVATGKGLRENERLRALGRAPRHFVADVRAAVDVILAQGK
jgi:D-glycero-D-manno-heptose 1,7-bisphosphate phosphatase